MAGAFTERLPPPSGQSLTEGAPIGRLVAAVGELQRGAVAGMEIKIAGMRARAQVRDNVIYLSGRVLDAPGDEEPRRPPYPEDGEFPGTDVDGGEWDESDSSSSGGGPEPVVPFTGDITLVKSVGIALSASGTRLTVTISAIPSTLQFLSGRLVSTSDGSAQVVEAHVDGEECGP